MKKTVFSARWLAIRIALATALAASACVVAEEDRASEDVAEQDVPYMPYVCHMAPFAPEGGCTLEVACDSGCVASYWWCINQGGAAEMYPIIVDGTCACHLSCDLSGGGGTGGGGGGGGSDSCQTGLACSGSVPGECGGGHCAASNACFCGDANK